MSMHGRPLTKGKRMYVIQIAEWKPASVGPATDTIWVNHTGLGHISKANDPDAILECKELQYAYVNRNNVFRLVDKIDGKPDVVIWEAGEK
jgi:hypothetical protein